MHFFHLDSRRRSHKYWKRWRIDLGETIRRRNQTEFVPYRTRSLIDGEFRKEHKWITIVRTYEAKDWKTKTKRCYVCYFSFITYRSCKHLDGKHTIFGKVVGGMETLSEMERIEVDSKDRPIEDIIILNAHIFVDPYQEVDEQVWNCI